MKFRNRLYSGSHSHFKRIVKYAFVDFLIVVVAYVLTILIWSLDSPLNYVVRPLFIVVIALILVLIEYVFGVYRRIWSHTSGHGMMVIINAVLMATLIIVVFDLLMPAERFPLRIIAFGNLLSLCGFVGVRYRSRLATSVLWRWKAVVLREFPRPDTRVLIIGAGEAGQALALRLMHRFNNGHYKVVGFIDDDPDKQKMYVESCPVVGVRKDIVHIAEALQIDLIVVAIHNISGPDFREILAACENTKAIIKVIPNLEALVNAKQSGGLLRDVQPEDLIGRSVLTRHEAVDLTPVTRKVVLITGAAGSIGSELSRQIMQYSPTKAVLLDNNESGLHDLITELRAKHPGVNLIPALVDITLPSALRLVYETHRPQLVFHAAAYKHVPMLEFYLWEALRVNVGGTRHVAELARDFCVERFVLISTDKAVNPSSIMGASKRVCELLLHALSEREGCSTAYTSVRFGNVFGSRGSVVPTFNHQIDNGGPVTVTDRNMTRYFMSIPEAVNLIIHAACMTNGNDIYVLRMGEVVRIVDLAERMIRLRGLRPYTDIQIEFTGTRPGEKLYEELFYGAEMPLETLHPDILKVNTGSEAFHWPDFWEKVNRLTQEAPGDQKNTLAALLRLIKPEHYPTSKERYTAAH